MARGKGGSWSKASLGADLRLYGWTDFIERNIAMESTWEIERAVVEAVPEAFVKVETSEDASRGVTIHVRVRAEDLAVFEHGPMHEMAIRKARQAALHALQGCSWTRVRLGERA